MTAGGQSPARGAAVDRWALGVFVTIVVLAAPLLLYLGRDQWFFLDEWWLLGDGADSLDGYFGAYNGHWVTVPAMIYRVNYRMWGLHTYLPYQVPVVLLHLGSAVLLRVVIRRLGVRGWIATAAAVVFVFFGSGSLNILFGFQVSMTGSLFLGLTLLLLADRDGPIDRRDWFGLAIGFVGLMTSGIFVLLAVGVGVAVLLRRGARVAAFYTVPLGIVYGVWYILYGREHSAGEDSALSSSALGDAVRFVDRMLSGTFTSLGGSGLVGIALGLVVVGTVGAVLVRAMRSRAWTRLALPAGLMAAWVSFAAVTALARAGLFGAESGASDRYLHISAALLLPLIALGAEYLARRQVLLGALPVLLLAFGLRGNVDALADRDPYVLGNRDQVVWLAHSEHIDDVPPDVEPLVTGIRLPVTAGWLAREADAGHIPEPTGSDAAAELSAFGALALRQPEHGADEAHCTRVTRGPIKLALAPGDRIVFEGNILIAVLDGRGSSGLVGFTSELGSSLVARLGPLDVVVRDARGGPPRLCEPDPSEPAVDDEPPAQSR